MTVLDGSEMKLRSNANGHSPQFQAQVESNQVTNPPTHPSIRHLFYLYPTTP